MERNLNINNLLSFYQPILDFNIENLIEFLLMKNYGNKCKIRKELGNRLILKQTMLKQQFLY
jgi:hypothetical protein